MFEPGSEFNLPDTNNQAPNGEVQRQKCELCPNEKTRGHWCDKCGEKVFGYPKKKQDVEPLELQPCKVYDCKWDVINNGFCKRHQPSTHTVVPISNVSIEEDTKQNNNCCICNVTLRGSIYKNAGVCAKHYNSNSQRRSCAEKECTIIPKNVRSLYCYNHDKQKQKERNSKPFLRDIDMLDFDEC